MRFLFNEDKNVMVITTKKILENKDKIYTVYHDSDDGMWQFIGNSDSDNSEVCLVSLEEICKLDDTVNDLYDMPCGFMAYKENGQWKISEQ
jgi:hypothetical protein